LNTPAEKWIVGVDAGGSKTQAWLVRLTQAGATPSATGKLGGTMAGELMGIGQVGPANVRSVGPAVAAQAIETAIQTAVTDACSRWPASVDTLDTIWVGAAGAAQPEFAQPLEACLRRIHPEQSIAVQGDVALVMAVAAADTRGELDADEPWSDVSLPAGCGPRSLGPLPLIMDLPVVAVIAGTGSVVCGHGSAGERFQCGGWGPVIGDLGSGTWMGQQALQAVGQAADRSGPATGLLPVLLQHFGVRTPRELSRLAAQWQRPAEVAALAYWVCKLAAEDAVASEIVDAAAKHLAAQTHTVIRQLSQPPSAIRLALAGSLLTGTSILARRLLEQLNLLAGPRRPDHVTSRPQCEDWPPIVVRVREPVYGAVLLASRAVNELGLGQD